MAEVKIDFSVFVSSMKHMPPWNEDQNNEHLNNTIRILLEKCSGGRTMEMLKDVLSTDERVVLLIIDDQFSNQNENDNINQNNVLTDSKSESSHDENTQNSVPTENDKEIFTAVVTVTAAMISAVSENVSNKNHISPSDLTSFQDKVPLNNVEEEVTGKISTQDKLSEANVKKIPEEKKSLAEKPPLDNSQSDLMMDQIDPNPSTLPEKSCSSFLDQEAIENDWVKFKPENLGLKKEDIIRNEYPKVMLNRLKGYSFPYKVRDFNISTEKGLEYKGQTPEVGVQSDELLNKRPDEMIFGHPSYTFEAIMEEIAYVPETTYRSPWKKPILICSIPLSRTTEKKSATLTKPETSIKKSLSKQIQYTTCHLCPYKYKGFEKQSLIRHVIHHHFFEKLCEELPVGMDQYKVVFS